MYLKASIDIDSVAIVKLVKIDGSNKTANSSSSFGYVNETSTFNESNTVSIDKKKSSLALLGISNEGYITFKYENNV